MSGPDLGAPCGTGSGEPSPAVSAASGFDPSRILEAIFSERVILACSAAKAVPGDVWGCGGEGHYAFLCGLSAMLNLRSDDLEEMITRERAKAVSWVDRHHEVPISMVCPERIIANLGFCRDSDRSPKGGDACGSVRSTTARAEGIAEVNQIPPDSPISGV